MKIEAPPRFFGRSTKELEELLLTEFSVKERFRAGQIYDWLYARRVRSFSEMTNLPRSLQRALEECYRIPSLVCSHISKSADGTKKFLFGLEDGLAIETVLIPSEM